MKINGQKKIKTARFLLEILKNPLLQTLIVIFTITGIAIGYGFGLLSETLTSSPKKNIIASSNLPITIVKKENTDLNKEMIKTSVNNKYKKIRNTSKVHNKLSKSEKNLVTSSFEKKSNKKKSKIAIVFDDLGIDIPRSARAIKLKSPLTLSFITYAPKLKKQTNKARDAGHELWMHMPMEPQSQSIDPGPNVLLTGLPKKELLAAINWNLKQFNNYVGINNHMGSRFTSDLESVRIFMKELKKRNLMFLDSRTSNQSVAQRAAIEAKVPFIVRNIFIDHLDKTSEIRKSLLQIEKLAEKNGYAVAIGHPRDKTLKEVENWLNTLEEKGLELVPLSKLINRP